MGRRKQQRKKSLSVTQPSLSSDTKESFQSTDCDTSSRQPPVRSAVTRAQEAVLLRALLELVVVQLAVGVEEINMAPVPTPLPNNQQGTGLSKLMSPVQDLGRSLLSFLVGTSNPSPATTSTFHPESEPPPVPPVKRASSKPDTLTSNTSKRNSLVPNPSAVASPGRQRPPGHPAHPTATSQTPAAVRRLGGAQRPQELPIPPYKDVPISPPPPQDAIPSSGTNEAAPAEISSCQPPTANRARRKKNKKAKKDTVEPETKSQVQQSELLQKAPDFPLQQVLCSEGEHQLCPPGAVCGSSQPADVDVGQGWVTARNSVCDPLGFSDPSQDTVRQEEEGHPAPEVAAGPPVAEELVAHRREHATRAATDVGSTHGSVSTGQLTGGGDTKQPPSEKEESEGGVSQPVLESPSSASTTVSVPPAPPAPPAPLSHSSYGVVPVPPPPPPEGFLLEGLKSPPVSRAAEVAKGPSGTLKRNTRLTREEALLGQLSVLDDSFSSFLRTQLNITTAARDRDSVSELTDTATTRRKKERKRQNDGENSDCHGQGSSKAEVDQDKLDASEETHKKSLSQEAQDLAGASKKVTVTEVRGRTSSNASEAASKGGRDRPISFADISEGLEGGVKDSKVSDNGTAEVDILKLEAPEKLTKEIKVEQGGDSQVKKTTESNFKPGLAKAEAAFEATMAPVVVSRQEGLTGSSLKKAEQIVINKSEVPNEGEINQANFTDATNKKVMAAPQPAPASHPKEEIGGKSGEKKQTQKPNKKGMGMIQSSGKEASKKVEKEKNQAEETEVEKQQMKVETRPCVKQELSKSDSGYSGHISCGEEEPLPARRELNMEQAMRRFHKRLVPKEQAPAKPTTPRKRTDTEGTTATEDSDDSEDEDYHVVGRLGTSFIQSSRIRHSIHHCSTFLVISLFNGQQLRLAQLGSTLGCGHC